LRIERLNPQSAIRNFDLMHIRRFTAYIVRLPFKRAFVHASAARHESENILIRCELADGTVGWGEGVPRSYVTGETPEGCLAQLAATPIAEQLSADCTSWPDVLTLCEQFSPANVQDDPRRCYGNSLRCAVELGVLDAYGRLMREQVSAATAAYPPARSILAVQSPQDIQYSAILDAGVGGLGRKSLLYRLYGFRHCKVKVGAQGGDDVQRLATIRRWIGARMDLRIDANEAWHANELVARTESLAKYNISCVEQPVPHAEVLALRELRGIVPMPIMLDESLTSETDAWAAISGNTCDLFNLRLSKCGGFLACLRLAVIARSAGLDFQLGCHPGETGILSAAGRHWACSVHGPRYLEGSYDRHLFRRLLTREDITFGLGGWAKTLPGPGLGVTVDPAVLESVMACEREFSIT
jgi:muconate cycloisomerase